MNNITTKHLEVTMSNNKHTQLVDFSNPNADKIISASTQSTMSNNKQYMYLVYYSQGVWDDYVKLEIFVTMDQAKAQAYVDKFNCLLNKWKSYFSKMEGIDDAWLLMHLHSNEKLMRASQIINTNQAYVEKIEVR